MPGGDGLDDHRYLTFFVFSCCRYIRETEAGHHKVRVQQNIAVGSSTLQARNSTAGRGPDASVVDPGVARLLDYVYGDANQRVAATLSTPLGVISAQQVAEAEAVLLNVHEAIQNHGAHSREVGVARASKDRIERGTAVQCYKAV